MAEKDGGAAFPREFSQWPDSATGTANFRAQRGMSMRDWFAGRAMQAYVDDVDLTPEAVAEMAYKQADAMLAERVK